MQATLDDRVTLRDAYLIMYEFAYQYWLRGQKQDTMTDFIVDTGPVLQDQTQDPAQIGDWLKAATDHLSNPPGWSR